MGTKEILFRASSIGALLVEGKKTTCTDKQLETIATLLQKTKLTEKQKEELDRLIAKRDAQPELSETAKRFIEKTWLANEKRFFEELDNKYISKGLYSETDAIDLISELDGEFYVKNTERITKGNITGECDIVTHKDGKKIIKDTKCSWSPLTFLTAEMTTLYEAQGICYMYLYDADEFHLEYCLVDTPEHIVEQERWKLRNRYNVLDPEEESVSPLFEQLEYNLLFSNNPYYTKEERRKTFVIERNLEKEKALLDKIPMAVNYYNTITLNQK